VSKDALGLSRGRRLVLWLIGLIALLTIAAGVVLGGFAYLNYQFASPTDAPDVARTFNVPDGAGYSRVADLLQDEGLIESARTFKLVTRLRNPDIRLVPGEFRLSPRSSMAEISRVLEEGKVVQYRFTAPEGLTVAQVLRLMDADPVLVDDDPDAPAEGSLLPETYLFPRGTTQSDLVAQMVSAHDAALRELWASREAGLPVATPAEAVTLASIVEKETGMDGERHKVAGVFTNRLRRGMRLESDPTIIYGITKGEPLGRGLRRSEIDTKTAWNTYQIDGLPPTPIANPGRGALAAVMRPAKTDALFFVADGTGGHAFAATYREHLRNVAKWRAIERQRSRGG